MRTHSLKFLLLTLFLFISASLKAQPPLSENSTNNDRSETENVCKSVFSGAPKPGESLRRAFHWFKLETSTDDMPSSIAHHFWKQMDRPMGDAIFTVPLATAYNWSLEQLYHLSATPFSVRMRSDVNGKIEVVGPQNVMVINDLRKIDADLVRKIHSLQKDPVLLAEVREKMYQDNLQKLLRENRTRNRDQIRKQATDITDKLLANGVQIGAVRLTMRTGEIFTDIFTTYSNEEDNDQIYDSLLRDLYRFNAPNRIWYNVMTIQYFHSHLNASPLTHADFQIAEWLASLARRVDRRVPVHMYASFERDGYLVMFHHNR